MIVSVGASIFFVHVMNIVMLGPECHPPLLEGLQEQLVLALSAVASIQALGPVDEQ